MLSRPINPLRRLHQICVTIFNSILPLALPLSHPMHVKHRVLTEVKHRDPTEWEKIYVGVESGKVVSSASWNHELLGQSFALISQWVVREGGEIRAISPAGWHTCIDQPNVPCGACECVNQPSHPMGYSLSVRIYRRELIDFLRATEGNRSDILAR